jgi:hypothetical protein
MAYQTNFGETVDIGNVNVGRSNSARGEGTTTEELVTKIRSMNCVASLTVLVLHTLPGVLNPMRLMVLISSPIRLIAEILVASLALFLLLVEARIPVFGEKAILYVRGIAGSHNFIDLNLASGRVFALIAMSGLLALTNLLTAGFFSALTYGNGGPSSVVELTNATAVNNSSNNNIQSKDMSSAASGPSPLFIFIQCTLFSPTIVMLSLSIIYTLYLMQNFPEFANSTAYECLPPIGPNSEITPVTDSGRPSWVSNIWSNANVRGSGYQSLDV